MRFASRMNELAPIPTLAMNTKAAEMKAQGIDVISFAAGEPDFDTPEHVKEGAIRGLRDGATKYTAVRGTLPLREAICDWVKEHKGLNYDPKTEAIVTVGGKQSVFNALHVLVEQGDEVVIPAPIWVAYEPIATLTGARAILVQTSEENGHKMTAEELREVLSPRTRIVVINSPCNPSGCVYSREELEAIAEVVSSTDALVMSDEIYGKITYDGEEHVSIASLSPEMKARTLVLDGFSKTYAMTGWRMGYTLTMPEIINAMDTLQGQSTSNVTSFAQHGGIAALRGSHAFLEEWLSQYDERRKAIVKGFNSIEGLRVVNPKGAFYAFPRVSDVFGRQGPKGELKNSMDVGLYLLEHARCAGVPGAGFGNDAYIRFSYATSLANVTEGIKRIRAALGQLG